MLVASLVFLSAACGGGSERPGAPPADGLVQDRVLVDGHTTLVRHSDWDMGRTQDLFDADPVTLARTRNANPAIVEILFTTPRRVGRVEVTTGSTSVGVVCKATLAGGGEKTFGREFRGLPADPTVAVDFPGPDEALVKLRVEITDLKGGDGHIHIRALQLS